MALFIFYQTIALAAGFALDALIGDPHRLPHPIRLIGKRISGAEKRLRRKFPHTRDGELKAGRMLVLCVALPCLLIPLALTIIAYMINPIAYVVIEAILCYYILAAGSLRRESMRVYKALEQGNTEGARKAVSMIVGRDTKELDERGIIKAAVETVAENTTDGVVAPLIYTAIGGSPLGFLYKAVSTMDSMVGYKSKEYLFFGRFAARADDALNFIPARLCAALMIAASYLCGFDTFNAISIHRRDARKTASPNAGQTESVCAGALDIELGGDAVYSGVLMKKPLLGDAVREARVSDIRNADKLMYVTAVIALAVCLALKIIVWRLI